LEHLSCLYIGRGTEQISFASVHLQDPARFYLLSYPAHRTYPTRLAAKIQAEAVDLGTTAGCNKRRVHKYIHAGGIQSCQLVLGFTELETGSAWNTMPPHRHTRRSEVYLYFHLAAGDRVVHLMGPPQETRHVIVANRQAVISPGWSIHAGFGTSAYAFCWGMGGENQDYSDMDPVAVTSLR
jgi:4-deoxy-L-threo-5-hexosulose-uronate ketol-isomerase